MSSATPDSLFYSPDSYVDRMNHADLFPAERPLEVEIGSGDGSFLVHYAAAHPELNLIGVERLLGRIKKIDKRGRREGLTNLRLMRIEANYFVRYLLPLNYVAAFHIYFPDPWPKAKHEKNRLIQPPFLKLLADVLKPGGLVHLRTDNIPYYAQMLEVFGAAEQFESAETPAELKSVITDFESGFNAQGISTNYATYRLAK
jgi:tRNA (guanine-N7-)-methyltransferase